MTNWGQVWFLLAPYALFTLAFGGSVVPRLNLYAPWMSSDCV